MLGMIRLTVAAADIEPGMSRPSNPNALRVRASNLLVLLVIVLAALLVAAGSALAAADETPSNAPKGKSAFEQRVPDPASIDAYLAGKGSPMAGQGANFVSSGVRWKVDPRLLVAIAGAESAFGSITCAPYNGWGWGCPDGPYNFTSWADGIETVTRGLRVGYLAEGRTSVVLIQQKYAPSGAANDPTGLNNHWVTNVSRFLIEMGGNPDDLDLDGVAGKRPLGMEFDPAAQVEFDFVSEAGPKAEQKVLTINQGALTPVTIEIRNTGSQTWTVGTVRLRRVDIEPRVASAPFAALATGAVEPEKTAKFTVQLASIGTSDDAGQTVWRLEGPGGPFGPEITRAVRVEVGDFAARPEGQPEYKTDSKGQTIAVLRFRNIGDDAWDRSVVLGVVSRQGVGYQHFQWIDQDTPTRLLERTVEPGQVGSFAVLMGAPGGGTTEFAPRRGDQLATGTPVSIGPLGR
jgi:hypothetical protein